MGKKLLLILFINFVLLIFSLNGGSFGCGSDSSSTIEEEGEANALAITSLKDANGTSIGTSGTTGVFPTSFELVVDRSITSNDDITLTCGDLTAETSTTASESEDYTYTITVDDAWKYGYMECTFTVSTSVLSSLTKANGKALVETVTTTYSFQNAPAVNDDFNVQTISDGDSSPWTVQTDGPTITTWAGMSDIISFNTSESTVDADFTGYGGHRITVLKLADVDEDFKIEMYIVSATTNDGSDFSVFLTDGLGSKGYEVGIAGYAGEGQSCFVTASDTDIGFNSAFHDACSQEDSSFYIKFEFNKSGDIIRQYKVDDGEYSNLTWDSSTSAWQDLDLSGDLEIHLKFESAAVGAEMAQIGYVKVTGMTVEGQY